MEPKHEHSLENTDLRYGQELSKETITCFALGNYIWRENCYERRGYTPQFWLFILKIC